MSQSVQESFGLHSLHKITILLCHQVYAKTTVNKLSNDRAKSQLAFKISISKMKTGVQSCKVRDSLLRINTHLLVRCFCRHYMVHKWLDLGARALKRAGHLMPVINVDEQRPSARAGSLVRSVGTRGKNAYMEQAKETERSCGCN